MQTMF